MASPTRDDPSAQQRQWKAIERALEPAVGVKTIVELLPRSTGIFTAELARAGFQVTGSELPTGQIATKSVDCVLCLRPLSQDDAPTRRRQLLELGRVSRRWIVIDYPRHSLRSASWKIARTLKAEFEDAGLLLVKIVPVRRFFSDQWVVLAECGYTDPQALAIKLQGTVYADLAIGEKLGEGKRSVVYRARWKGREVGVKVYKPAAIAAHARKHKLPLAEFEHLRNKAFFEARGLAKYVAEPLGYVVEPGFQLSLQELVDGEVYYFAQRDRAGFISPRFMQDLTELVALSHAARLYDIDLHAMNVMVDRRQGSPKLFDFNQIPFDERPQNPLVALALRLGLLGRESRDLRKLASFNDFERIERRLLKFYEAAAKSRD